jgi:uncharacterized protein YidB (DUF937 family)
MGLLDGLLGSVLGKALGGGQQGNALVDAAMGLLNNQQGGGGLNGLLEKFKSSGLGDHAASWVGTGQNMPVSGDQVHNALGGDFINQIASKLGVDPSHASGGLAQLLPTLIDKLTPDGAVPQDGNQLEQGLASLKKMLGQ